MAIVVMKITKRPIAIIVNIVACSTSIRQTSDGALQSVFHLRYRNECQNRNIRKQCYKHGHKIRRILNIDRVNSTEGDDECLICNESLDTSSIWGRFVCRCPHWYHYDCLVTYVTKEGSYHMDRLKCIICRESPRSIETL